jgi:hypothetical protein
MSAVLAALLDRVGFRRFFGGRSMQAAVEESQRDRTYLSHYEGVGDHRSVGGAEDQYRLAIIHYVWEMLMVVWLLVGTPPLVVFFAFGNVPSRSSQALLIYPIVTLFSSVSWASSLATYWVRRHTSFLISWSLQVWPGLRQLFYNGVCFRCLCLQFDWNVAVHAGRTSRSCPALPSHPSGW